jgi:hypothetical protein
VDGFGSFFDERSARAAIGAYLDVMADGLEAYKALCDHQAKQENRLLGPCPMTGRRLMFGTVDLHSMKLLATQSGESCLKVLGGGGGGDSAYEGMVKVSQGERFEGDVDLRQLVRDAPESDDVSWCITEFEAATLPTQVLTSVSSKATFGHLLEHSGLLWGDLGNDARWDESDATFAILCMGCTAWTTSEAVSFC